MSRGHEGALQESFKVEERLKSGVPRVTTLHTRHYTYTTYLHYTYTTNHGESADPTHRNQWRGAFGVLIHTLHDPCTYWTVHMLVRAHIYSLLAAQIFIHSHVWLDAQSHNTPSRAEKYLKDVVLLKGFTPALRGIQSST